MAEFAGWERGEEGVVFVVRRGEDDGGGAGAIEEDALAGSEARRVEVLNDFDDGGGIVRGEARVAIASCAGA